RLLEELPQILHRAGVTAITVTHDQEEAFALADRVALMRAGEVMQIGTPRELYRQPGSPWVARFLGLPNLLSAKVVAPGRVQTALGSLAVGTAGGDDWQVGSQMQLLIRPEAARLLPAKADQSTMARTEGADRNRITLEVTRCSFRGPYCQIDGRHQSGIELTFMFSAGVESPEVGETIALSLDPHALTLLEDGQELPRLTSV
ncbi:MAG: TOBE domain-containing protein, partial [Anaerolineae bacterium]